MQTGLCIANGYSWRAISSARPSAAQQRRLITRPAITPNGGPAADGIDRRADGLARKPARLRADGVQRTLLGEPKDKSQWGTGMIPGDQVVDWSLRQGLPDACEFNRGPACQRRRFYHRLQILRPGPREVAIG